MINKCVIFLFLATAYTVLLAHNFTPHTHQSEREAHHHEGGNKHHHNDNNEEQNKENTATPFHLLQHTGGSAIVFIPGQIIQTEIQKKVVETANIKLSDLVIKVIDKPPLILPFCRTQYLPQSQILHYFFLLKAPPAFTAWFLFGLLAFSLFI